MGRTARLGECATRKFTPFGPERPNEFGRTPGGVGSRTPQQTWWASDLAGSELLLCGLISGATIRRTPPSRNPRSFVYSAGESANHRALARNGRIYSAA